MNDGRQFCVSLNVTKKNQGITELSQRIEKLILSFLTDNVGIYKQGCLLLIDKARAKDKT